MYNIFFILIREADEKYVAEKLEVPTDQYVYLHSAINAINDAINTISTLFSFGVAMEYSDNVELEQTYTMFTQEMDKKWRCINNSWAAITGVVYTDSDESEGTIQYEKMCINQNFGLNPYDVYDLSSKPKWDNIQNNARLRETQEKLIELFGEEV